MSRHPVGSAYVFVYLWYYFSKKSRCVRSMETSLSAKDMFLRWRMPFFLWPSARIWLVITLFQGKLQGLISGVISYNFYRCCTENLAIKKTVNSGFILCRGVPHAWKINEKFLVHCLLKIPPFYSTLIVNPLFDILTDGSC